MTTTVVAGGTWTIGGINVTSLGDGTITYTATARDAAGNTATSTKTATKDTVAPSVAITTVTAAIDSTNQTKTSASGTGTAGLTVTVVATDGTHSSAPQTATVGNGGKWTVNNIDVSALNDGTITYTVTISDAASNSATATKTSDKNTAGSTSHATTTTVTTNHSSGSTYGQSVTFTATIASASGTPTGTVQFQVDGVNFGAAQTLSGGIASISDTGLTAGSHTIKAIYSSDSNNFVSSQGNFSQSVAKAVLTITADNKTKVFGATNPTLTASFNGFVNSDTSASLSSSRR